MEKAEGKDGGGKEKKLGIKWRKDGKNEEKMGKLRKIWE